jgi:hypothetical protein
LPTAIVDGDLAAVDHHGDVDLRPYLRAHGYLRVEQPPTLWEADCDDELLIRLTGELIASALARGTDLPDVLLRASNVVIDPGVEVPEPGDYVALTVEGVGDWGPEMLWDPAAAAGGTLLNRDVDAAARAVGICWGYTRTGDGHGSVTVLLPRLTVRDGD